MIGEQRGLGLRENPDEDFVLTELLRDYRRLEGDPKPGSFLSYLTDELGRTLEAQYGFPQNRYGRILKTLFHDGTLQGAQIIGAPTRWHITEIPDWTWSRFYAAQPAS